MGNDVCTILHIPAVQRLDGESLGGCYHESSLNRKRVTNVLVRYATYVGFFLGMGLLSGSIVHMPLNPSRYATVMVVGILLFLAASFVTEVYLEKKEMPPLQIARSLLCSLGLSVGVGMVSGSIQHFSDNVVYASYLIPIGFGLSLFSFFLKNEATFSLKKLSLILAFFLALGIPLRLSLAYVADQQSRVVIIRPGEDGHDHTH